MTWTLKKLVDELSKHDQSLTLSFETAQGAAGPGISRDRIQGFKC